MRHLLLALIIASTGTAFAQNAPQGNSLDRVLSLTAQPSESLGIPDVRAAALKELGRALGLRAGLSDGSEDVLREIEKDKARLDAKYHFGSLMFASGALPPVIEEAKDVISLMDYSMRVAGKVYRIIAPARFMGANWRDYLFLGLSTEKDPLVNDAQRSIYPRNDAERRYWEKVVREGYADGRAEAINIFQVNLARLERDFYGMRRYYELAARKLVSEPAIATATEAVSRPDPNTIIIGESVIRITQQPAFEGDASKWQVRQ